MNHQPLHARSTSPAGGRAAPGRRRWGRPNAQSGRPEARRPSASVRVWAIPLALAAATSFGLLSALLGQHGVWWVLSWIALSAPAAVILVCLVRARRRRRRLEGAVKP